jgi:formylglycine-generating enzyme required for sulfatase activity
VDTKRLGKYEIIEKLGKGGFATVFRAHDTTLRRDVALKILHQVMVADPDFVRRFENDARAAANLEHPRIVTVHDMGQLEQRFYIAMQFLPGGSLTDRIKREGPFSFEEAVVVVQQVAEALAYAHQKGFVHRDIKPTNILFDAQGEAVVSDFGLVKAAESSIVARSTVGGIVGTPAYIAPEAWEERDVSPATDVYALGCVFFEMLTGKRLFKGETSPAVMMAHFRPPEYPEQWPEGVPPEVEGVLGEALMQDPDKRYASMGNFATALEELVAQVADPLATPYEGLEIALTEGRWDDALQRADEIIAQDAGYRDVQTLRKRAVEGKAEAERAQWAAQWREKALEAEQQGDVEAARVAAKRWLDMAPESPEAKALLERLKPVAKEPPPGPETEPQTGQPLPAPPDSQPQPPDDRTTGTGSPEKSGLSQVPLWGWALGGMAIIALIVGIALSQGKGVVPLDTPSVTVTLSPDMLPPANASWGDTWTRPVDGAVMVYVPSGEFQMGSTEEEVDIALQLCKERWEDCERDWFDEESPADIVDLDGFWIDKYEVTNSQFAMFLNEQGNQKEGGITFLNLGGTTWFNLESPYCAIEKSNGEFQPKSGYANHPVNSVTWYGARAYSRWVGGRLPSDAEWEKAARGTDGWIYPWGDKRPTIELCNFADNNRGATKLIAETPVGTYSPEGDSPYGCADMAGNVTEWTRSIHEVAGFDPEGKQVTRVFENAAVRGGSASSNAYGVRCADLGYLDLNNNRNYRFRDVGFRVVMYPQ